MAVDSLANFAYSTVATAPSPATSGVTLIVHAGDGALFPVAPFDLTIWPPNAQPTVLNAEISRCTNVSTDTLTIVRGQYGTTPQPVAIGYQVAQTVTANLLGQLMSGSYLALQFFGDGSDGNFSPSSGTTVLTRDMFYNNLTLTGTASINTAGFNVYVAGILDLSLAQASAIFWNGATGNPGTATAGGAAIGNAASYWGGSGGGAGGAGGTTAIGTVGTSSITSALLKWGGQSNAGGAGGAGSAHAGGAGGTVLNGSAFLRRTSLTPVLAGTVNVQGGEAGTGGGGGGGDGTNRGGGGGGGGQGAGLVYISARTINRSSAGNANVIQANAGTGGAGFTPLAGACGGGGGGSGGGGGAILLQFALLTGTTQMNVIQADGGAGGAGGSGIGSGGIAGTGGSGGYGGQSLLVNITTGVITFAGGTAGSAGSGTTGGTPGTLQVSL